MEVLESKREPIEALLREHGILPTQQRVQIAAVLMARPQHLSAEQVLELVNARDAATSRATIYNTLNLFVERGLIREVIVDPERAFYDSNVTPHHHYYDVESGALFDIDATDVRVEGLPGLPEGMVAERTDIIVRIRRRIE
jgi:Fur family iron response transcriptional regulator